MGQKEDKLIAKGKLAMGVRMALIILIVTLIVLEGGGLMRYFYAKGTESSPLAAPIFVGLLVLGLVLVVVIIIRGQHSARQLARLSAEKEQMERELKIASDIQMSMIPKTFPPYPERSDLDMAAAIIPAKEVGGDFYDFFIRDEKLFFCIADVSGKGVPAALVMAVTRSLFRTQAAHEKSPARIVTALNRSMTEINENSMFVTMFCGVLDLATGHIRYCNAGHNAPVLLSGKIALLPVEANIPLGVDMAFQFKEQETDLPYDAALFLYTDGVPEAAGPAGEMFGEHRMFEALRPRGAAQLHIDNVHSAVRKFVGSNDPSDDLTMLFIHYLNDAHPDSFERHLILHNDIQQIPQLAGFVGTIADEMRLDQSMAMSLNLALEEAVTNVILYAYPDGSDGIVDIEAIMRRDTLEFIVTDNGMPFDPTAVPDVDVNADLEQRGIGGLGIFLVRTLMDSVEYQRKDNQNVLRMIKKL